VNKENLGNAIKGLKFLGMIDEEDNVTPMGNFATYFPLSVNGSAILYRWFEDKDNYDNAFPGIVLVCMIDCFDEGYFYYSVRADDPKTRQLEVEDAFKEHFEKFAGKTDLESIIL